MIGRITLLESEVESPGAGLGLGASVGEADGTTDGVASGDDDVPALTDGTSVGEGDAATATVKVHWTRSMSPSSAETDVDRTS
jgi:hypothetical protein